MKSETILFVESTCRLIYFVCIRKKRKIIGIFIKHENKILYLFKKTAGLFWAID